MDFVQAFAVPCKLINRGCLLMDLIHTMRRDPKTSKPEVKDSVDFSCQTARQLL